MRPALFAAALLLGATPAQGAPPAWRDLNHNGQRDVYEDTRQPVEARVRDLLGQMTLEEKVGTLLHGTLPAVDSPFGASSKGYDLAAIQKLIGGTHITSFITRLTMAPADLAAQSNAVQKIAEASRLGIPVTISTDPRHHFAEMAGASSRAIGFSLWPEPLGLAALGKAETVRQFARIAAKDYRAVGIHMALSPMADLATEPRWSRISGTFGADARVVSSLAGAYVEGFQGGGSGLKPGGVATVVKHWVAYGAAPEGFDGHNRYGSTVRLTASQLEEHISAFRKPFAVGSAGVMPTYAIVKVGGAAAEASVGANFDPHLLGPMLRGQNGFRGLVVSDWGVANDCADPCRNPTKDNPQMPWHIAMPWGVEGLSRDARMARAVSAGVDQIGGEDDPAPLLAAMGKGLLSEARVNMAARRVLETKFRLGLFDSPYVAADAARTRVGTDQDVAAAEKAQRQAQVLLQNRSLLPLKPGQKVWLYGLPADAARAAGLVPVVRPEDAELAIIRSATPFETLHPFHFFGRMQHEGRLDFRPGDAAYDAVMALPDRLPVVFAVDMDRPAILTLVQPRAAAILALFGASDAALLDVLTGRVQPKGRLPFNLPRSMAAVEAQDPAAPDDDRDPLYPRGFGLRLAR